MATMKARLALLEDKQTAKMPMLPAMVVMPNQDHDAARAQFFAKHGRLPVHVLSIRRVWTRKKQVSAAPTGPKVLNNLLILAIR